MLSFPREYWTIAKSHAALRRSSFFFLAYFDPEFLSHQPGDAALYTPSYAEKNALASTDIGNCVRNWSPNFLDSTPVPLKLMHHQNNVWCIGFHGIAIESRKFTPIKAQSPISINITAFFPRIYVCCTGKMSVGETKFTVIWGSDENSAVEAETFL